ncbi:MAG: protein kinase [Deltaproteobacteria bacterium]|uniref:Protein kinase n=1 Tax=Candidatus Desulfacyla euxinica TaxID=2841693 RepID=A0A8J6N2U4_9DELT|nr:protein kinase [Candidatus Desulfacyla euxinica]
MSRKEMNCWEYMKCGREPGGNNAKELGICPASNDGSYDGIHSGKNAGRFCWAVAGTFCGGKVQGSFAEKRASCISCEFFQKVQTEEGIADLRTKFLRFVNRGTAAPFLSNLTYRHMKAGERFITQGEVSDTAFIIQRGSCLVIVEKDGELHPVRHLGEGDIVGELTILTGEPQNAHVEAQTDMDLWVLNKAQFEDTTREEPELLDFLTELVANRFDSRRPTADRVIGKYIATEIIGRGGYSIVFKGIDSGLNMPVVIKMMRHDLALEPDFLNDFLNEAKTIASLNHENIIKVYDIEKRFKTVFIIEEYVDGEVLKEMLKRLKTIPPAAAVEFLIQICAGLLYAHQHGIIHRDINPANIIVQPYRPLKILDFGLACPIGAKALDLSGTVFYMAPEQINAKTVDQRTDIYSLGISAYEMLTGKRPFPEENIDALMDIRCKEEIPDPAAIVPDLPEELRGFVLKACRRRPEKRYQDVGEALKDLQPLVARFGSKNCLSECF